MKACRNCKYIVVSGDTCPVCGSKQLTEKFFGMVYIFDTESSLAKVLGITVKGPYALRVKVR